MSCSWVPVGGRRGGRSRCHLAAKEISRQVRAAVLLSSVDEKDQLKHRCGTPLIQHLLSEFRAGHLKAEAAYRELGLSRSRFYELYHDYLAAGLQRNQQWVPRSSGGNHARPWPVEVRALLRERLSSRPPSSYSFAASEALRKYRFKLDRAQVRRWAIQNRLAHPSRVSPPPVAVRRWQRSRIGELWQLDASPHPFFPRSRKAVPMLNLIDDCSRLFTGSKLYQREVLLAYYDLLSEAFSAYGLPLILYVDFHSFFFTSTPRGPHGAGPSAPFLWRNLSLRAHAASQGQGGTPTPVLAEPAPGLLRRREHHHPGENANSHIRELRLHHNLQEVHREIKMTPQQAWDLALKQNRSALRPKPNCPWWPFVWSLRTSVRVSPQGYVPIATQSVRLEAPAGSRVVLCHHPSGHHSVLTHHPKPNTQPVILFSDLPK